MTPTLKTFNLPGRRAPIHLTFSPPVGVSAGGFVVFSARSAEPISAEAAQAVQAQAGFMPAGYGFYQFHPIEFADLDLERFGARWSCSTSCG